MRLVHRKTDVSPSVKYFLMTVPRRYFFCGSFMFFLSCVCYAFVRVCLFICALWSPAERGLTSWRSFVVYICEFVTIPLVSWVRCGTWLYRFLTFAPLLTLLSANFYFYLNLKRTFCKLTFGDSVQTPRSVLSDLGLHCLSTSHKKTLGLKCYPTHPIHTVAVVRFKVVILSVGESAVCGCSIFLIILTCFFASLMYCDFQQCDMCDHQSLRSACAYAQSDQSLC